MDLTVEATGSHEGGIQNVGTVRGADEDDVLLRREAVHLDQQLVEGRLTLFVAGVEVRGTFPGQGVDLVDEDDGRRVGLGLGEQIADTGSTDADIHLDEFGTGDREERDARFPGDRSREQGLAGTGRAHHQDTLRHAGAEAGELFGVSQVFDDLFQFLFLLFGPGHVVERRGTVALERELGLRELLSSLILTDLHLLLVLGHVPKRVVDDQERGDAAEKGKVDPVRDAAGVVHVDGLVRVLVIVLFDQLVDVLQEQLGIRDDGRAVSAGIFPLEDEVAAAHVEVVSGDFPLAEQTQKIGVFQLFALCVIKKLEQAETGPGDCQAGEAQAFHGCGSAGVRVLQLIKKLFESVFAQSADTSFLS